jgi:hypothetical protein
MDYVTYSRARVYLLTRRRVASEAAFSLNTTTTLSSWCLYTLLHIPTLTALLLSLPRVYTILKSYSPRISNYRTSLLVSSLVVRNVVRFL